GGAQHEIVGSVTASGSDVNLIRFNGLDGIVTTGCNRTLLDSVTAQFGLAFNPQGSTISPPVINSVSNNSFGDQVIISYTIHGGAALANTMVRVQFFGNPVRDQNQKVPLGSADVTLDASGNYSSTVLFNIAIGSAQFITANIVTVPASSPNVSCSGPVSLGFDTSGG